VTKRKPLEWYGVERNGKALGPAGEFPRCSKCCDLLFMPLFAEAVASCAIEQAGSAANLARRVIEDYHARRHPAAEWGLDGDRT
jgi:hypothetical protein